MDLTSIDLYLVIDTLPASADRHRTEDRARAVLGSDRRNRPCNEGTLVVRKMLTTAGAVALILVGLGELLSRLLHFSTGSLSIAGGIILVIIAVTMVPGSGDPEETGEIRGRDPLRMAVFPVHFVSTQPRW